MWNEKRKNVIVSRDVIFNEQSDLEKSQEVTIEEKTIYDENIISQDDEG